MPQYLTFRELEELWIRAGGDPAWAPTMAGIAWAESGGNPDAAYPGRTIRPGHGSATDATGLWQILGLPNGNFTAAQLTNPLDNARMAVAKFEEAQRAGESGLAPWTGDAFVNQIRSGPVSREKAIQVLRGLGAPSSFLADGGANPWPAYTDLPGYARLSAKEKKDLGEAIAETEATNAVMTHPHGLSPAALAVYREWVKLGAANERKVVNSLVNKSFGGFSLPGALGNLTGVFEKFFGDLSPALHGLLKVLAWITRPLTWLRIFAGIAGVVFLIGGGVAFAGVF